MDPHDKQSFFFLLRAARVRSSCEEGPGQSALQSAYHNPELDEQNRSKTKQPNRSGQKLQSNKLDRRRIRQKSVGQNLKLLWFAIGIETVCCENEEQRALKNSPLAASPTRRW